MAIVNPASDVSYERIPAHALAVIEEAILLTGENGPAAREALIQLAVSDELGAGDDSSAAVVDAWRSSPVEDRLSEAVVRGDDAFLREDLEAMLKEIQGREGSPVEIVEGPLMAGMSRVGTLFGDGKLFLPQVVRSARTMKHAVDILQPHIEAYLHSAHAESGHQGPKKIGTIVMATVKGDVHDIGKNIVDLVLTCNNFEVIDLGVMVPAERILEAALSHRADIVGLSGLITPSLSEMANVCSLFQRQGMKIPIMVGGATTSELHTALKLVPLYDGPVIQTSDASAMASAALKIVAPDEPRALFLEQVADRTAALRKRTPKPTRPRTSYGTPVRRLSGARLPMKMPLFDDMSREGPRSFPLRSVSACSMVSPSTT
jgi:5-methyltetrahydrofolate--homocysteine methyltransferase